MLHVPAIIVTTPPGVKVVSYTQPETALQGLDVQQGSRPSAPASSSSSPTKDEPVVGSGVLDNGSKQSGSTNGQLSSMGPQDQRIFKLEQNTSGPMVEAAFAMQATLQASFEAKSAPFKHPTQLVQNFITRAFFAIASL